MQFANIDRPAAVAIDSMVLKVRHRPLKPAALLLLILLAPAAAENKNALVSRKKMNMNAKKGKGGGSNGGGLEWLEGTWYTCDNRWTEAVDDQAFVAPPLQCTMLFQMTNTALNEEKTSFQYVLNWAASCSNLNLQGADCPNAWDIPGYVQLKKYFVGTKSLNPSAKTFVFVSHYEEYQDAAGNWQAVWAEKVDDYERKECDVSKGSNTKTLYCESDWHVKRYDADGNVIDRVISMSTSLVKDLKDCSKC